MVKDVREGPADAGQVEHRGRDVFVSYSRADREIVVALTGKLSAAGKKAWVDLEDIPPSAEWMSEIRSAIGSSDGMLSRLRTSDSRLDEHDLRPMKTCVHCSGTPTELDSA